MNRVAIVGFIFITTFGILGLFVASAQATIAASDAHLPILEPVRESDGPQDAAEIDVNRIERDPERVVSAAPAAVTAGTLEATLNDLLVVDNGASGVADLGDVLQYTTVITHVAADSEPFEALHLTTDLDSNLMYVPGSFDSSPLAYSDVYTTLRDTMMVITASNGVLSGARAQYGADLDLDGDTLTVTAVSDAATSLAGSITLDARGAFTYTPPAGIDSMTDVYTYTVSDEDGYQDQATLSIYLDDREIIFVDSSLAAAGNGTIEAPYNDLGTALSIAIAGDRLFLYEGSGTYSVSSISLLNDQFFVGEGFEGSFAAAFDLPDSYINALFPAAGNKPIIECSAATDCLTVAQRNTLRGFAASTTQTAPYVLTGTNFGALTTTHLTLSGTGSALFLNNGEVNGSFDSVVAQNPDSTDEAVYLRNLSGRLSVAQLAITNGEQSGLLLDNTGADLVLSIAAGSIVSMTPATVNDHGIELQTGGNAEVTVNISNTVLSDSGESLVWLQTQGSSVLSTTFNGVTMPSQTYSTGIAIESAGSSRNVLVLQDVTAENIDSTFLRAADVGGSSAVEISADNLVVTGTNDTGATIMTLSPSSGAAISATLLNSHLRESAGDTIDLRLVNGTIALDVQNSTIAASQNGDGVQLFLTDRSTGRITADIQNTTLLDVSQDAFKITGNSVLTNEGEVHLNLDNVQILNPIESGIDARIVQQNNLTLTMTGGTAISGTGATFRGIYVDGFGSGELNVALDGVSLSGMNGSSADAIRISSSDSLNTSISANNVVVSNVSGQFADAIHIIADGNSTVAADLSNFIISDFSSSSADGFVFEVQDSGVGVFTTTNSTLSNFSGTLNRAFHLDGRGTITDSLNASLHLYAENIVATNFADSQSRGFHVQGDYGNRIFVEANQVTLSNFTGTNSQAALFELLNGAEVTATIRHMTATNFPMADSFGIEALQNMSIDADATVTDTSLLNLSVLSSTFETIGYEGVFWQVENDGVATGLFQGNVISDAGAVGTTHAALSINIDTGSVTSDALAAMTVHNNSFFGSSEESTVEFKLEGGSTGDIRFTDNSLPDSPTGASFQPNTFTFQVVSTANGCLDISGNVINRGSTVFSGVRLNHFGSNTLNVAQALGASSALAISGIEASNTITGGVSVLGSGGFSNGSCTTPALSASAAFPLMVEAVGSGLVEVELGPTIAWRESPSAGKQADSLPRRSAELVVSALVNDLSFTVPALLPDKVLTLTFRAEIGDPLAVLTDRVAAYGRITTTSGIDLRTSDPAPDLVNYPPANGETITPIQINTDVALTKRVNLATASPGESLTYTVVVENRSLQTTTVVVSDVVNMAAFAALDFSCTAGSGSTCAAPDVGLINDTTAEIAGGGTITYVVTGQLLANLGSGIVTNTATVLMRGVVTDTVTNNNSETVTTTLVPHADLAITKTVNSAAAVAGETITYTIVVANEVGPSDIAAVTVEDNFAAAIASVSWTCAAGGSASCGVATGSGNLNETVSLPVGGVVTYTAVAVLNSGATGSVTNTATVTATGVVDSVSGNDSSTVVTSLSQSADLGVVKTADRATMAAGDTLTYTLVVTNTGPSDVSNGSLTDLFPADLSGVVWSCVATGGGSCASASGSGDIAETGLGIPVGGVLTYTAVATVASDAINSPLSNTASVGGSGYTELSAANNNSVANVTLTRSADLSIVKRSEPAVVVPGGAVTYTLVLRNLGLSDAIGARVQDTMPTEIDPVSVTWGCAISSGICPTTSLIDLDETLTLTAGTVATYTAVGTIQSTVTGTLTNTATITVGVGVSDPVAGNNSATVVDSLQPQADLVVTLSDSADPVALSQPLSLTVVVTNSGPSRADSVAISVTLPSELNYVSDDCGGSNGAVWLHAGVTLNVGESVRCELGVQVDGGASGGVVNSGAVVAHEGGVTDPNTGNDTVSEPTTIVRGAFSIEDDTTIEGGTAHFTVTLSTALPYTASVVATSASNTAVSPADFTPVNSTLLFTPGVTSLVVPVTTIADGLDEVTETFAINLGSAQAAVIADSVAVGTISDNDASPLLTLSTADVNEGAGVVVYTATLSVVSGLDVGFSYVITDGTATAGSDYVTVSGGVVISAGASSATMTTTLVSDAVYEADETVRLLVSGLSNATAASTSVTATILNDDSLPILTVGDVTVAESVGQAVVTITTDALSAFPVTMTVNTADNTATAGSDYTAVSSVQAVIPAGSQQVTVTVPITDDLLNEVSETLTVTVSSVLSATVSDGVALVTISDNDALPLLTLSTADVNEDSGVVVYTATLSAVSGLDISFSYLITDGTAIAGGDYATVSGSATILAGSNSTTVTTTVVVDAVYEADETVQLGVSGLSNATAAGSVITATILNDDSVPTLTLSTADVNEDSGVVVYTATLSAVSGLDVGFTYVVTDGTAVAGSDYVTVNGTATILAGSLSTVVTTTVMADTTYEADETVRLLISGVSNGAAASSVVTATILNDDSLPAVSVADVTVSEGVGSAVITVTADVLSAFPITMVVNTADDTAIAGSDYTAVGGQQVVIPAGSQQVTTTISIVDDLLYEMTETFTVTLSGIVSATLSDPTAVVTILDNEGLPQLYIGDATVSEGAGTATFPITTTGASVVTMTVDIALASGSATLGSDFDNLLYGSISLLPGVTSGTVVVTITEDLLDERSPETFSVTLSNPISVTLGDGSAIGSITDNDGAPTLSVADLSVDEGAGAAVFTMTLSAVSGQAISLTVNTADLSAVGGIDYSVMSETVVIGAGQLTWTVSVPITDDLLIESIETFTLTVAAVDPSVVTVTDGQAVGTIIDNDVDLVVGFSEARFGVSEAVGTAVITVELNAVAGFPITVDYETRDSNATAGSDYTAVSGTITFTAGVTQTTFTVPVIDDLLDEPDEEEVYDERVILWLSNPSGPAITISPFRAYLAIKDNDGVPSVYFDVKTDNVTYNEGDGTVLIPVSLSNASGFAVDVKYRSLDGTAMKGADYNEVEGTISFTSGETMKMIELPLLNDAIYEGAEQFQLTLSNPVRADLGVYGTITVTLNDETPAPVLTVGDVSVVEGDSGTTAAVVTVTRVGGTTVPVTVTVSTADGTAVAGSDYVASSQTISLAANEMSKTVSIEINGDEDIEETETFDVNLSGAVNATIGDGLGVVTIVTDDTTYQIWLPLAINKGVSADEALGTLLVYPEGHSEIQPPNE